MTGRPAAKSRYGLQICRPLRSSAGYNSSYCHPITSSLIVTYGRRISGGTPVAEFTAQRVMGGARRRTMSLIIRLRSLVRQEEGQDLLEYALLVALIALVAVAAV